MKDVVRSNGFNTYETEQELIKLEHSCKKYIEFYQAGLFKDSRFFDVKSLTESSKNMGALLESLDN